MVDPASSDNERPVSPGRLGFGDKILEAAAAAGVAIIAAILIRYWDALPPTIPRNFDNFGNVSAWGSRSALAVVSACIIILYIILTIIGRFPHLFSYPWRITRRNAAAQYRIARSFLLWVKAEIVWMFTFIQWKAVQVALGQAAGLGSGFMPIALLIVNGTIVAAICRAYLSR